MTKPTQQASWKNLQKLYGENKGVTLASLFAHDPARAGRMTLKVEGLEADFSRSSITPEIMDTLLTLAKEQGVEAMREKMFTGEKINATEGRAVLHTALRVQSDAPVVVDGENVIPAIRALHAKMERFTSDVRDGKWLGATGKAITDVVNIGIGGSDLGPRFVVSALRAQASTPRVHFVANVDPFDFLSVVENLNPETTLFVVVSKTFTTQETLLNASSARAWLVSALGEAAVARHFVAVSTNKQAVEFFGIKADNMFAMWDWVGGRYSLWSAVGLSIALAVGWPAFRELLAGAAAMDAHFRTAPLEANMPVLFGLVGIWNRNFCGAEAEAVLPYSERLRELPRFLQQLNMESNGKSVTRGGEAVDYQTGPVIFGECGSVGQHSFHQWLHQGTGRVAAEFIGVRHDDMSRPDHAAVLQAHMMAQIEALKSGRVDADPARTNAGNKPSTVLWMSRLDPYHLGLLLALYEHKVFVQGVLWDINSFDQFGVELGKKLAGELLAKA
ncbi:MAG: glucose-6-phosphate isomerase [Bdellovibrionales bacterium]|jgi:glucose-6-phosphate isomerase